MTLAIEEIVNHSYEIHNTWSFFNFMFNLSASLQASRFKQVYIFNLTNIWMDIKWTLISLIFYYQLEDSILSTFLVKRTVNLAIMVMKTGVHI